MNPLLLRHIIGTSFSARRRAKARWAKAGPGNGHSLRVSLISAMRVAPGRMLRG